MHNKLYRNSIKGNPCGRGFFPCDHRCEICDLDKKHINMSESIKMLNSMNREVLEKQNTQGFQHKKLYSQNSFADKMYPHDKPKEECGVFGVICKDQTVHVAQICYQGLIAIQHRGQQAAGLTVVDTKKNIYTYTDVGLVNEAIPLNILARLWGHASIGHVKYETSDFETEISTQPFHFKANNTEFSISFNGRLTNAQQLKNKLIEKGRIFFSNSNSEIIAQIIASNTDRTTDWVENLQMTQAVLEGAYAMIILTKEGNIYGMRDPYGIKPLIFGKGKYFDTELLMISSESCAFDLIDAKIVRDIQPGEIVFFNKDIELTTKAILERQNKRVYHCMCEYFTSQDRFNT